MPDLSVVLREEADEAREEAKQLREQLDRERALRLAVQRLASLDKDPSASRDEQEIGKLRRLIEELSVETARAPAPEDPQLPHVKREAAKLKVELGQCERALKFWQRRSDAFRDGLEALAKALGANCGPLDRNVLSALARVTHLLEDARPRPEPTVLPTEDGGSALVVAVPPPPASFTLRVRGDTTGDKVRTLLAQYGMSLEDLDEIEVTARVVSRVVRVEHRVRFDGEASR